MFNKEAVPFSFFAKERTWNTSTLTVKKPDLTEGYFLIHSADTKFTSENWKLKRLS